ncbi:MAG: DPP IV N-terminal domain-containing protein [Balneolaceae bacterium]
MKSCTTLSILTLILLLPATVAGQGSLEDYQRAESFMPQKLDSLVFNTTLSAAWVSEGEKLIYREDGPGMKRYWIVEPESGERTPAFDHERLASALGEATGRNHRPLELPFNQYDLFGEDLLTMRFRYGSREWECDLEEYLCSERQPDTPVPPGTSPDGEWTAFVEGYNLFVRSNRTGEVLQLTSDGHEGYGYAIPQPSPIQMVQEESMEVERSVQVRWSPDSRKLVTYRLDERSARDFALVQSSPRSQLRPIHYIYSYPLATEAAVPVSEIHIFNIHTRRSVKADVDPWPLRWYGSGALPTWFSDSETLWFLDRKRGFEVVELVRIEARTGQSELVHREELDTHIDADMNRFEILEEKGEFLMTSERDGWHHIYRFDLSSGELLNQVTSGEWVVRDILHVDEENEVIFFAAAGIEDGVDPYLRQIYRVGFNGRNLRALTTEGGDHNASFSPNGKWFRDTWSLVHHAPVTALRSSEDGSIVRILAEADVERLYDHGWVAPEPFQGLSTDGETELFGVIWRPSNFDSSRSWPVIEKVYTGPHNFHVPKTFNAYRSDAQAIAELGFIVVQVDGRGTARRSRAFREESFKNLGGASIDDRIFVMRQMAESYPYMDLDRVGIYGHSAGGYDTAHSILTRPEFYKVAVSSAGNHDHRMDKAWWNEQWMGYPEGPHYEEQSNVTHAPALEGKLLLVHGELDENVHPAATMQVVDALIRANRNFDMLIMPNMHHRLSHHPFFVRSRWDYFVRHLHGTEPPHYNIESLPVPE